MRKSSEFWVAEYAKMGCAVLLLLGVAYDGGTLHIWVDVSGHVIC
jgi:hypothetical protein